MQLLHRKEVTGFVIGLLVLVEEHIHFFPDTQFWPRLCVPQAQNWAAHDREALQCAAVSARQTAMQNWPIHLQTNRNVLYKVRILVHLYCIVCII